MAQSDATLDGSGSGLVLVQDTESALQALFTNNSGLTAPPVTYANQWWVDTALGRLKLRNPENTAWIDKGALNPTFTHVVRNGDPVGFPSNGEHLVQLDQPFATGTNPGNYYNFGNGQWICPVSSWWTFEGSVLIQWDASQATAFIGTGIMIGGLSFINQQLVPASGQLTVQRTVTRYVVAGTTVALTVFFGSAVQGKLIRPAADTYFIAREVAR